MFCETQDEIDHDVQSNPLIRQLINLVTMLCLTNNDSALIWVVTASACEKPSLSPVCAILLM